jgi:hypothetical protein
MAGTRDRRRWRLCGALLGMAVTLAACGGGSSAAQTTTAPQARPSSTGHLALVSPTQGEVFTTPTIPVKVTLTGAKIVPITSTNLKPNEGHMHLSLDNKLISMNYQADTVIHDVTPGTHVVRVEFVATDHAPFDPRVFVEVTITVQP